MMFLAEIKNKGKYIAYHPNRGWYLADRQGEAYAFTSRERARSVWNMLRTGVISCRCVTCMAYRGRVPAELIFREVSDAEAFGRQQNRLRARVGEKLGGEERK
jgi:hypothetical protein